MSYNKIQIVLICYLYLIFIMSKNKSSKKDIDMEIPSKTNEHIQFLLVEKDGNIKEVLFNKFNIDELYKKCGFRKPDNFECRTQWKSIKHGKNKYTIEVWSRNDGKANTENKYDFPPPIDKDLYFGNCAILQIDTITKKYKNLTKELWVKLYEVLFGNFENLNETYQNDEDEPDELMNVKKDLKTKKTGYLKDGFVVDSDDDIDESDNNSEISSSDEGSSEYNSETSEETDNPSDEEEIDDEEQEQEPLDELEYNSDVIKKTKKNKPSIKNKNLKSKCGNKILQTTTSGLISVSGVGVIPHKNGSIHLSSTTNINEDLYIDDLANGSELTFEDYDYDIN